MLLLIYSARKRSDCVFGVLFECPVDLFPSGFLFNRIVFKFVHVVACFPLRAGSSFRSGMVYFAAVRSRLCC